MTTRRGCSGLRSSDDFDGDFDGDGDGSGVTSENLEALWWFSTGPVDFPVVS
jgi:hypothetical protein